MLSDKQEESVGHLIHEQEGIIAGCHKYIGQLRSWAEHNIWRDRNEGSNTCFHSCSVCGASVQPQDRETHEDWHRRVS